MKRLSMAALRRMSSAACESDARVVVDPEVGGFFEIRWHDGEKLVVRISGMREMRLVGKQLLALADFLQEQASPVEDVDA